MCHSRPPFVSARKGHSMSKTVYSSSNSMVWEYFGIVYRLAAALDSDDDQKRRQNTALCVLLAVTAVEAFFNLYFQVLVTASPYSEHEQSIRHWLSKPRSLDAKITEWPKRIFKQPIDMSTGIGKRFADLKRLRNKLMHFSDLQKSVPIAGTHIHNFSDITFYENLKDSDAWNAYHTALRFIVEVLKLEGGTDEALAVRTVRWTAVSLPVILEFSEI